MTDIRSFLISNDVGDEVCISNFGARIIQWYTEVAGDERNIVLGYSSLADYQEDPFYVGAIVGPYANRIAKANINIHGEDIELTANEGSNQLHGGPNALSHMLWELVEQQENSIALSCTLEDGHNGYPGPVTFNVTYLLSNDSELQIHMNATTEKATVIGPTAHPYFNLAGIEQDAANHLLNLNADYYTEVDERNIPTGNILSVEETRFDFRQPRILGDEERDKIDHNFVINQRDDWQGILISPDKQLQLHVSSNYPGLQVYTGDYLAGRFSPRQGICLEPQYYPNSPNQDGFPFVLTTPEQPFSARIHYRLVKPHDKSTEAKIDSDGDITELQG